MTRFFYSHRFLVVLFIASVSAYGATGTARVVELSGDVFLTLEGTPKANLQLKDQIPHGAVIETAGTGVVKLMMPDRSVVNLGPDSYLKVNFSGNNAEQINLDFDQGRMRAFVSKKITGRRAFNVKTPVATMGVRGTEFIVNVFRPAEGEMRAEFFCIKGSISVQDHVGKSLGEFSKGYSMTVAANITPTGVIRAPAQQVEPPKPKTMQPSLIEKLNSDQFLKPLSSSDQKPEAGNALVHGSEAVPVAPVAGKPGSILERKPTSESLSTGPSQLKPEKHGGVLDVVNKPMDGKKIEDNIIHSGGIKTQDHNKGTGVGLPVVTGGDGLGKPAISSGNLGVGNAIKEGFESGVMRPGATAGGSTAGAVTAPKSTSGSGADAAISGSAVVVKPVTNVVSEGARAPATNLAPHKPRPGTITDTTVKPVETKTDDGSKYPTEMIQPGVKRY